MIRVPKPALELRSFCLLALASLLLPASVLADGATPAGEIFQVNTFTDYYQYDPKVATDGAGSFVVIWSSGFTPLPGPDGAYSAVQARRYDSAGCAIGDEFTVNTQTNAGEFASSVDMNSNGTFVVSWLRTPFPQYPGAYPSSPRLQRFDSAGQRVGEEDALEAEGGAPKVTLDGLGRYTATWPSDVETLISLRFDDAGMPLGDVIPFDTGRRRGWEVAMDDDGRSLTVWGDSLGGGLCNIAGQLVDSAGVPEGNIFQVNTTTIGCSEEPDAAFLEDAGFVVVWERGPGSGLQLLGQVFDSAGSPRGEEFEVNTYGTDIQLSPRVAADPLTGGFTVVWTRQETTANSGNVKWLLGRSFDAEGQRLAQEFRVSAPGETYDFMRGNDIAIGSDGGFIIVWSRQNIGGEYEIYARRILRDIFTDGFESGDTDAWGTTVAGVK